MKRKNLLALIVVIGVLAVIDLPRLMSNCPSFPDGGYCGDPTTLGYCNPTNHPCTCATSGCHGGTVSTNTTGTLTIMIVDSAVYNITGTFETLTSSFQDTPGHTYLMAFELNSNTGIYGFQMTALNLTLDSAMAGSFVVTDPTHTHIEQGVFNPNLQFISHHNASSFLNWAFKWVAPINSAPVTFYYNYNLSTVAFLDSPYAGGVGGVGYPGGQIYSGNVTIQSAVSGINDINDKITDISIFPNPVSDQFNLSFSLKQSEPISLNVYSVDGKMVEQLMQNETKGAGYFNSSYDISNLGAGIYLAKLSVGGASITKKITKL